MTNRQTNIIASVLLIFVFVITVASMSGDSVTMDEVAHLPSGYSYLTQKDMRLNPEHPPLVKDLAAIPLLFIKGIEFPYDIKAWQSDVNGQWDFGFNFLYGRGNPVDKMIFWGRIPMILILILLGFYIFKWSRELFGNNGALLALLLFSFSPTFLAHGRLVTTDVAAATGAFIATYYFVQALKRPDGKNIILAGIIFGAAQLLKFSVILLIPLFVFLAAIWWLFQSKQLWNTFKTLILVFIIGFIVMWPVYQYHVWGYPVERQVSDTKFILASFKYPVISNAIVWMADKPILRAYAQYLLGLAMVIQRATGGNTTYFLGEVSASGWKNYFPVVYLIKETLTLHILTFIAVFYALFIGLRQIKKPIFTNIFRGIGSFIRYRFAELSMLSFVAIYWITSLTSNLNIGVRHLLPAFPFTIVLVAGTVALLLKDPYLKIKKAVLAALIIWQVFSVISVYPHFLSYFNEAVGGPKKGYLYSVDSNLDWGQDLKRLKKWVDVNNVDKIYIEYFGGGDARYYLKEKFAPWSGSLTEAEFPKDNYLAVSATFLQGGRGKPVPGFNQKQGHYLWLNKYTPVTKIGNSIFVYYIQER